MSTTHEYSKLFTVDEANSMLPLLRSITRDLVDLSRELVDRQQRIEHLKGDRDMLEGNPYDDELSQAERELELDKRRLQDYVSELRQLGVEPKSATDGLIDFPSEMDGRVVYLCWKLGEAEILHWHELNAGFAGRQSLTADSSR